MGSLWDNIQVPALTRFEIDSLRVFRELVLIVVQTHGYYTRLAWNGGFTIEHEFRAFTTDISDKHSSATTVEM